MTNEEMACAFSMRLNGYTLQEIADKYGITKQGVSQMFHKTCEERNKSIQCIFPNICKWMRENHLTQTKLATMLGFSNPTISSYLLGKSDPSFYFCREILRISGMTFEEAFQTEEEH